MSAGVLGSALTDAAGNYVLAGMPYGASYTLTASKLGYRFNVASYSGTVTGDAVRSFAALSARYSVSGRVMFGRAGLAGVRVDGGVLGSTQTNPNGEFFFNNIPYGQQYLISFSKRGYTFSQTEIAGDATENLRLNLTASVARYVVSGIVLVNGAPLAGVKLTDKELGSTVSDEAGRFSFNAAKYNTRYQVTASKAGYRFRPATKGGVVRDDVELQYTASGAKQGSFRVARRR